MTADVHWYRPWGPKAFRPAHSSFILTALLVPWALPKPVILMPGFGKKGLRLEVLRAKYYKKATMDIF
jgi:hypothetical protein